MTTKESAVLSAEDWENQQLLIDDSKIIAQFFELIRELKKNFTIQFRDGKDGLGERLVHIYESTKIQNNNAWIGFKCNGFYYRTETIACRNAFMEWLKETLEWVKEQTNLSSKSLDYVSTLPTAPRACFIPVWGFSTSI